MIVDPNRHIDQVIFVIDATTLNLDQECWFSQDIIPSISHFRVFLQVCHKETGLLPIAVITKLDISIISEGKIRTYLETIGFPSNYIFAIRNILNDDGSLSNTTEFSVLVLLRTCQLRQSTLRLQRDQNDTILTRPLSTMSSQNGS